MLPPLDNCDPGDECDDEGQSPDWQIEDFEAYWLEKNIDREDSGMAGV